MIYTEDAAKATITEVISQTTSKSDREYELFISSRERISAGEYKASITARFALDATDAETLTKEFMKLFIQGDEIIFVRSYPAVVAEKGLRVIDFILEATISLSN